MDPADKRTLSKALPELLDAIKVDARLKAHLYAADIFEEETLDELFRESENEKVIFQLVQNLKRKEGGALDAFLSVLRTAKQNNAATLINHQRSRGPETILPQDPTSRVYQLPPREAPPTADTSAATDHRVLRHHTPHGALEITVRVPPGHTGITLHIAPH